MKGHHWALKLRALKRSLLATAGVSTIAVALGGAAFAAPGVTPSTVTDTLLPGASQTISKSVETSPIPPNPDIFFLADTTGSMGGAVANVRTGNANVMATVLTRAANGGIRRRRVQGHHRRLRLPAQPGDHSQHG